MTLPFCLVIWNKEIYSLPDVIAAKELSYTDILVVYEACMFSHGKGANTKG